MEFSCLKALLLFNDDNDALKNVKQVEQVKKTNDKIIYDKKIINDDNNALKKVKQIE